MKKTISIFLSAIILLLIINPVTAAAKKQTAFLSKAKMLQDYDTMWNIIDENYPYMGVAERFTGNDFNKVKALYRKKIKEGTTKKEYADIINSCLNQFNGTGHMNMLYNDETYAYFLSTYKGLADSGHCKLIYDTLDNKVSRQFYNYKINNKKDANTTSSQSGASSSTVNFTTKEYKDIQTAYIKIPSFANPQMNVTALQEYFKKISDYKYCILDLRGNSGGSDYYWTNGIVEPNLKGDISVPYYFLAKGNMAKQYIESDNTTCLPIKDFDSSIMANINQKDFAGMDYYFEDIRSYTKAENPLFKGNFYVLTDSYNYSSSESFIQFCKRTGFAKLVGETTGGDGMGIDPMVFALPNSGICFRFSSLYSLNTDGSSNEEQGTKPDIEYNSLDFCLDLIKGTK